MSNKSNNNLFRNNKTRKTENGESNFKKQELAKRQGLIQNDNQLNKPITIIKKKSNLNHEFNEKINPKTINVQDTQKRDVSKKAKKIIQSQQKSHHTSEKKNNNEQNDNNKINENDKYNEQVIQKLRNSSLSKNSFNSKKEKKNDFLKVSINITGDPEFESYLKENEQPKKEKNNFNNLFNSPTTIKNENNINNMFKPQTNINVRKLHNNNIKKFSEDKINTNKNEPYKIKDKQIDQENLSSKKKIIQNINNNIEEINQTGKRSFKKKNTYNSQIVLKDEKLISQFTFEKKKTLKCSAKESPSLKGSLKDSLRKSSTFGRASINNSTNNIIIPLLNRTKENNCFLNVIIQVIFNLNEFKKELLEVNENLASNSKTIKEFYNLLKSYASEQIKNKDNKNQIEPIISVNDLRYLLNNIYKCYRPGEAGDPMETLGYILDLIHRIYWKKRNENPKIIENCKCPSHQYFFLKLVDIISCPHCNVRKVQMYDKDCFMFNILTKDIIGKLHAKNFISYKMKLFSKLKEHNEIYENEKKIKIPGCNCNSIMMQSYQKKIKLNGPSSTYLVINITWSEEFPSMLEILMIYGLIPISESINNLFTFGEDIKTKINDVYYIKSIILYGIYHYVCIIYIKDQRKWAIIDDKIIKYICKYYELIDFLLRNHLMPVGIIYSKDRNDEINEYELKLNTLNKEDFLNLYQFCKEVDLRRGLKVSDIVKSKGSFNENNENYLNNNYFYKSIIDFLPNNENNKQDLINNVSSGKKIQNTFNSKTTIKPNNIFKEKNNSNNNLKLTNKDNNLEEKDENNKKHDNLKGRKIMGDFSDNNMKGGILILSSSMNDNTGNNEKSGQTKEESDFQDFGKNYVGDEDN